MEAPSRLLSKVKFAIFCQKYIFLLVNNYPAKVNLKLNTKFVIELGKVVDINGCKVFYLPPNNFSLYKTEKCAGENSITMRFESSHNYNISVQGAVKTVGSSLGERWDITDLSAGNYSICVTVDGVNASEFERCFEVNISEPDPLRVYAISDESNEIFTNTIS